jgi:hypothetical protein
MRRYITHNTNLGISNQVSRVRTNTLCNLLVRDYNKVNQSLANNLTNQIPLGNYTSNYFTK